MKKGLYINCKSYKEESELKTCGVMRKVYSHINVLREHFNVEHILVNTYVQNNNIWHKIKMRLPFLPVGAKWKYSQKYAGYDFIYFRKAEIDYSVYTFLKNIKKHNPNCKILFEIPTYPYEKEEYLRFVEKPMRWKSRINGKRLKKWVDVIVTVTPETEILGLPVLYTKNGIDTSKTILPNRNNPTKTIHFIEVSRPSFWHGYDRFIKGMGEYYKNGGKRNIVFHVVGNGAEINNFKNIATNYNILDKVIFHGDKFGTELDEIYAKCYVGIDCLGCHRKGEGKISSLKSREYACKGLPIISSSKMDFLEEGSKYFLQVPADETPINIEEVINFYDGIYKDNNAQTVATEIRKIAEERCDMKVTFKPVVDYINE